MGGVGPAPEAQVMVVVVPAPEAQVMVVVVPAPEAQVVVWEWKVRVLGLCVRQSQLGWCGCGDGGGGGCGCKYFAAPASAA